MSNVVLIRFTCFAVFLLRLFNFCLLYLFIYFLLPYKMVKQVIARERPDDDMPPPMAVRRWQESQRIYVRPRTGPQSARLWWPAVTKLQAASVPIA